MNPLAKADVSMVKSEILRRRESFVLQAMRWRGSLAKARTLLLVCAAALGALVGVADAKAQDSGAVVPQNGSAAPASPGCDTVQQPTAGDKAGDQVGGSLGGIIKLGAKKLSKKKATDTTVNCPPVPSQQPQAGGDGQQAANEQSGSQQPQSRAQAVDLTGGGARQGVWNSSKNGVVVAESGGIGIEWSFEEGRTEIPMFYVANAGSVAGKEPAQWQGKDTRTGKFYLAMGADASDGQRGLEVVPTGPGKASIRLIPVSQIPSEGFLDDSWGDMRQGASTQVSADPFSAGAPGSKAGVLVDDGGDPHKVTQVGGELAKSVRLFTEKDDTGKPIGMFKVDELNNVEILWKQGPYFVDKGGQVYSSSGVALSLKLPVNQ